MDKATPEEIEGELAKIGSLILTAQRLLSDGKQLDLSNLEARIRSACEVIAAVGPEAARPLLPSLQTVLRDIDQLGAELQHRIEISSVQP